MKDLIEITLDFETYYCKKSKYSLTAKGMTYEKYIRDNKFEVIGLAVKVGNRNTEWLSPHEIQDWINHIEVAYGWENVRLIAQNAVFDASILGLKFNVYPGQIADTMLMSKAVQQWDGNSLDVITRQLRTKYGWICVQNNDGSTWVGSATGENEQLKQFAVDKGTEVHDADGKHLCDFTDEEYDAYAQYCITDVDLTWSAYRFFLDYYGFPEQEIDVMTTSIEMYTYPVMELDTKVLEEVKANVNQLREESLARAGVTLEEVRSDAKFAEALMKLGVEPPTKINTKGEVKYAFAKKDLEFLKLLEHEDEGVRELAQARFDNKSSQAVTRVEDFLSKAERGKLCVGIEYYGARTGRFGGFEGNLQNLNRNKVVGKDTPYGRLVFYKGKVDRFMKLGSDGKVLLARAGWVENDEDELHEVGLRDSVKAPKGKTLVVNDLSQIECRILAYTAHEQWVLDAFVAKKDIYKAQASKSFGVPYEEITKSMRFVGKSQILGLGFQAGENGLRVVLGKRSEDFSSEELQGWVKSYRASVPNIVAFWRKYKAVLRAMVQGMNVGIDDKGILQLEGNCVVLPNGMKLVYRDIRCEKNENGFDQYVYWGRNIRTKKPDWENTFEGRMVENAVQALARIVLTTQMGWIKAEFRKRGWSRDDAHLAMQVHDELIVCCREDIAKEVLEIMQHYMAKPPHWASDLPLGSDGDIAKRYGCAK
jgi:DNA-directed DNA polymerase